MKLRILPIFILLHFNLYSQIECDTLVNKTEFRKLIYLVNECDDEVSNYQEKINKLEYLTTVQQQRIRFLEELIISRENFKIKKCPRLSKKRKKPKFKTS